MEHDIAQAILDFSQIRMRPSMTPAKGESRSRRALESRMIQVLTDRIRLLPPMSANGCSTLSQCIKRTAHAFAIDIGYEFWRCRSMSRGKLAVDEAVTHLAAYLDDELVNRSLDPADWSLIRGAFVRMAGELVNEVAKVLVREGSVFSAGDPDWTPSPMGCYDRVGTCDIDGCHHLGLWLGPTDQSGAWVPVISLCERHR
jgi:hypothetical protein